MRGASSPQTLGRSTTSESPESVHPAGLDFDFQPRAVAGCIAAVLSHLVCSDLVQLSQEMNTPVEPSHVTLWSYNAEKQKKNDEEE